MPIINDQTPDADEVMNAMGQILANQFLLIWNANINKEDDSVIPGMTNSTYDDFVSDSQTKTSMNYDATNDLYFGPTGIADGNLTTIDEFSDSSVNGAIWETGVISAGTTNTVTEDSSGFQIITTIDSRPTSAETFTRTKEDIKVNYNQVVRLRIHKTQGSTDSFGGATGGAKVYLSNSDSSTQLLLLTISDSYPTGGGFQDLDTTGWDIDVINAGDFTYWSIDGGTTWTRTDTSAYDEVKIKVTGWQSMGGGSATDIRSKVLLDWYRYNNTNIAFDITQTTASNASATITNAIPVMYADDDLVAPTFYLSADNGANFESVINKQIHRFTNTGTQIKTKMGWNQKTPGVAVNTGVMWNLY